VLDTSLLGVLGNGRLVVGNNLTLSLGSALLERSEVTLALQTHGGDETLDFGGLGVGLAGFPGDFTLDDKGSNIVLLVEVEESANTGSTLGAKTWASVSR